MTQKQVERHIHSYICSQERNELVVQCKVYGEGGKEDESQNLIRLDLNFLAKWPFQRRKCIAAEMNCRRTIRQLSLQ